MLGIQATEKCTISTQHIYAVLSFNVRFIIAGIHQRHPQSTAPPGFALCTWMHRLGLHHGVAGQNTNLVAASHRFLRKPAATQHASKPSRDLGCLKFNNHEPRVTGADSGPPALEVWPQHIQEATGMVRLANERNIYVGQSVAN